MKPLYLCSVEFGPVKCIPETKNKDFLPTKQMPTSTIFPSKLHLSQFVVSVTASYPVCLNVHCKKNDDSCTSKILDYDSQGPFTKFRV